MSRGKLSHKEARDYWRGVHRGVSSDLQAVCFPGKSALLNGFFDRIQTFAVRRALNELDLGGSAARVLEIGSGRGRWLRFFQGRGAKPTGVDVSPEAVAQCVDNGLAAIVGSAERLPLPSESFDLVVSVTVLLHLPPEEQQRAAAEMQRVCRSGGSLLLLESSARDTSPHVWSRAASEWIALFGECRPVLQESHYFAFPLRLLWKTAIGAAPNRVQTVGENVAVLLSWPLEFVLMRIARGRIVLGSLQTLIVLRKNG